MTYEEIHKELREKGFTWARATEAMGCSVTHLMNTCSGRVESARIAKAVAVLIDKDVIDVFPGKPQYAEDKAAKNKAIVLEAKAKLKAAGLAAA